MRGGAGPVLIGKCPEKLKCPKTFVCDCSYIRKEVKSHRIVNRDSKHGCHHIVLGHMMSCEKGLLL